MEKPNTSIFDEALRLTKERHNIDVPPHEAIHIGDSISNDYIGARNANWKGILIKHDNDTTNETKIPKEDVFRNLEELREHFTMLFNKEIKST